MIDFTIDIKTVSEANSSEHWTKKSKRHKQQQFFVRLVFKKYVNEVKFPCEITMTRLSPRMLDDEENLPMAFKWIKDELGGCIFPEKIVTYLSKKGKIVKNKIHADSDLRIKWLYSQGKSPIQGIRIKIYFKKIIDH